MEKDKEKLALVFIHGFMCGARIFTPFKEALEGQGADIYTPVLAGHETTLEEFLKTDGEDWQRSVSQAVDSIRDSYDRIILVGHSMGGLLATREAARNPEKISDVIAIGYPIKVTVGPRWLKLNFMASHPEKPGEDPRVTMARRMCGIKMHGIAGYLKTLPNEIEFLKMTAKARRELSALSVPLTVINFHRDEIVAKSAGSYILRLLPETRLHLLPQSYHFLFVPQEFDQMLAIIRGKISCQDN